MEFFNFYTTFDFSKYALSLNDGTVTTKPDSSPLYIPNLFELGHNVSRNINDSHLLGLQKAMEAAVYSLETNSNRESNNWGLLSILQHSDTERPIQMKISDLFLHDNVDESNSSSSETDVGPRDIEKSKSEDNHVDDLKVTASADDTDYSSLEADRTGKIKVNGEVH